MKKLALAAASLGSLVASSLAAGFGVPTLNNEPPASPKPKRRSAPPRRFVSVSVPNAVRGGVRHNGTAFVYPQERASARRLRQMAHLDLLRDA